MDPFDAGWLSLLPPIIAKWNMLGDFDEGLLSILECLYYLIGVRAERG